MPLRSGYCGSDDLMLGDMPLPPWLSRDQAIAAAADEIDSYLGHTYVIPVVTTSPNGTAPEDQIPVFVGLTLKRINIALASGRAILQLDAPGENNRLHAYGASLVKEALEALQEIASGGIVLPNVPTIGGETDLSNVPLIYNVDGESAVEAFYDRIANPDYSFFPITGVPSGNATYYPRNFL